MPNLKLWGQRELTRLKQDMDHLFDSFCFDMGLPPICREGASGVHFAEEDHELIVSLHLPGVEAANIDLNATPTRLAITVTMERTADETAKQGLARTHRQTLHKEFTLPVRVHPGAAQAKLADGVLTVRLPLMDSPRLDVAD